MKGRCKYQAPQRSKYQELPRSVNDSNPRKGNDPEPTSASASCAAEPPAFHLTKFSDLMTLWLPGDCSVSNAESVHAQHVRFLQELIEHAPLAKPDKRCLSPPEASAETCNHGCIQREIDYYLLLKEKDFDMAMQEGFEIPALISASSPPGRYRPHVDDKTRGLSDSSLLQLLNLALWNKDHTVAIQNQPAKGARVTCQMSCKEVIDRFHVPPGRRTTPSNCLEIADGLFAGFPGPHLLENIDIVGRFQSDPDAGSKSAPDSQQSSRTETRNHSFFRDPGAKGLDRSLLISEKGAILRSYVGAVVATWIRCTQGGNVFWFQRGLTDVGLNVWGLTNGPPRHSHLWAFARLREGDTL